MISYHEHTRASAPRAYGKLARRELAVSVRARRFLRPGVDLSKKQSRGYNIVPTLGPLQSYALAGRDCQGEFLRRFFPRAVEAARTARNLRNALDANLL